MVPERHPPEAPADGEDSEHSEDDAWPDAQEDPADCESDADDEPEIVAPCSLMLPSLFRGRAPTVWFEYAAFVGKVRSAERQRIFKHVPGVGRADDALKFRSNHTITCLCGAFKRSGFKRLLKGNSYNVFWGHHLKEHQLQKLDMRQLVNHFPGSYGLGRKDYLWRNISRMARRHSGAYDFCAKSYVLPRDRELLERDFADGEVYIVKPPGSAEGRGIRLVNRPDGLPRPGQPAVVQHYIPNPYLINGKKFDLRIYVGVTSFDPLRAYIFDEGLVRFATADYAGGNKSIRNRFMHLTNYSVNRKSGQFEHNTAASNDGEGSKWSLTAFWRYMAERGADVDLLQKQIREIAVKTLVSVEHSVVSKCNQAGRPSCFEVFGFDVLIDAQLKAWLLEVNVACSLASSSPLDKQVKHFMITDLLHMVGVQPYDRRNSCTAEDDRRKARAAKAGAMIKKWNIFELRCTQLGSLCTDDYELIAAAEDENSRSGHWQRIFPCEGMDRYTEFFEFPRYRNTVLAKWMQRPDWSLLGPLLSPDLPSDHPARIAVAAAHSPPLTLAKGRRAGESSEEMSTGGKEGYSATNSSAVSTASSSQGPPPQDGEAPLPLANAPPLVAHAIVHRPMAASAAGRPGRALSSVGAATLSQRVLQASGGGAVPSSCRSVPGCRPSSAAHSSGSPRAFREIANGGPTSSHDYMSSILANHSSAALAMADMARIGIAERSAISTPMVAAAGTLVGYNIAGTRALQQLLGQERLLLGQERVTSSSVASALGLDCAHTPVVPLAPKPPPRTSTVNPASRPRGLGPLPGSRARGGALE